MADNFLSSDGLRVGGTTITSFDDISGGAPEFSAVGSYAVLIYGSTTGVNPGGTVSGSNVYSLSGNANSDELGLQSFWSYSSGQYLYIGSATIEYTGSNHNVDARSGTWRNMSIRVCSKANGNPKASGDVAGMSLFCRTA
jgi:hypothetical protein